MPPSEVYTLSREELLVHLLVVLQMGACNVVTGGMSLFGTRDSYRPTWSLVVLMGLSVVGEAAIVRPNTTG